MFGLNKRKVLLCYLVVIMIFSSMPLSAAYADNKVKVNSVLGQAKIGTNSLMRVKNVLLVPNSDKQTLAFTIEISNNDSKKISFFDYWINVKLSNGATIPVKLTSNNLNKNEIAPKTTAQYTFVGSVNRTTKYTDLIIQLIKWDFSAPNFTRVLSSVKLPASYATANNEKTVLVEATKLGTLFKDFRTYQLEDEKRIEFNLEYTNWGFKNIALPKYKYYFVTSNQYVYEITPVKNEEINIQPKAKATLQMKMTIPNSVNVTNGSVVVMYNDETAKIEVPINIFQVKLDTKPTVVETHGLNVEKNFSVDNYKYSVRLDSVQKLPMADENVVTSIVTILNQNSTVAPIPDLVGEIYLDGVAVAHDKVKKTQLDSTIGIPANGSVKIAIHTKTPHNYEYTNIKLEINNQIKTEGTEEVIKEKLVAYDVSENSFTGNTRVAVGSEANILTTGKTTMYKIHSLQTYEGINTYLYNILVEVQNKDTRAALLNKQVAYLKSQNNSYYPLKITEVKDKVNPSGKVILSMSVKVPAYSNTNAMKLVLGELVDEITYLSAVEFDIPNEITPDLAGNLKKLNIFPYELNINSINFNLDRNANAVFQYELIKKVDYDSVPDGHSIIMEVVDRKTKDVYRKEFKFETDLELGLHQQTMVAEMNIDNPDVKITEMDGLLVNIYDQFEGHKKLLGSRVVYSIFIK